MTFWYLRTLLTTFVVWGQLCLHWEYKYLDDYSQRTLWTKLVSFTFYSSDIYRWRRKRLHNEMAFFSFNSSNLARSSKKILESCCKNNAVITTSVLYDPKHGSLLPHHKSFHSISERGTSNCIQYNDIPIRFNSSSSGNKRYV